ncbi:MAG TPA: PIN domain-containing protein [Persephonella sp.]|nr:PIN domain-containing protein [Persephonella sp.]
MTVVVVDTNLWIYLFTDQDVEKKQVIKQITKSFSAKNQIVISTQIYKEIARVLKDKIKLSNREILEILSAIERLALIYPEMPQDIKTALEIKERYKLQFFDSVIIAFCLRKKVKVLLTEDISISKITYRERSINLVNPLQ